MDLGPARLDVGDAGGQCSSPEACARQGTSSIAALAAGLCLLGFPGLASADLSLEGDYVRISWGSSGNWNVDGAGFEGREAPADAFVDFTAGGDPWQHLGLAYVFGTFPLAGRSNSSSTVSSQNWVEVSESDLSSFDEQLGEHVIDSLVVRVTKRESWLEDERVVQVRLIFENTGSVDISDLRFVFAVDADIAVDAVAIAKQGPSTLALSMKVERDPSGTLRLSGTVGREVKLPPGEWQLVIILGRVGALSDWHDSPTDPVPDDDTTQIFEHTLIVTP